MAMFVCNSLAYLFKQPIYPYFLSDPGKYIDLGKPGAPRVDRMLAGPNGKETEVSFHSELLQCGSD